MSATNKTPRSVRAPRGQDEVGNEPDDFRADAGATQAPADLAPDLDQAARFLRALDPDPATRFLFKTLDDSGCDAPNLEEQHLGTLAERADDLAELNGRGAGIFVTINRTVPHRVRRRAEDVIAVRAVFVDLDGAPLQPVLDHHIKPHCIVETSPGKYHAHWFTDDVPLDQFSLIQLALAEQFNGDPSVHDLPRIARLAGFYHYKREPHLVRIVSLDADLPRYPGAIFGRKPTPVMKPYQERGPVTSCDIMLACAALAVIPPADPVSDHAWHDRNHIGMAAWRASDGDPEVYDAWCEWLHRSGRYSERHANRQWKKYGKNIHALKPGRRPLGLGTLIAMADIADPCWRDKMILDFVMAMLKDEEAHHG
ncbi:hypothetical protein EI171_29090 [Bradyrhizobium sp. LCT2]|uniref:DNA-primase RepB domain-containing protein n=1 Tax=Bradyrhizobium sp. LCT2 TaxID=2493093 RepID=UPI0013739733|nr:DNA-primase RepB domain-containing protein [Bradyrhizobium sp. LCT2]QHP70991.1 hypothetical protein EI171_29090 [Bradyrhizobium sp. LCT2]